MRLNRNGSAAMDARGLRSSSSSSGEWLYGMEMDATMWKQQEVCGRELNEVCKSAKREEGFEITDVPGAADPRRPRTPEPCGEEVALWDAGHRQVREGCEMVRKGKGVEQKTGGKNRVMLNVGGQFFETSVETLAFDYQSMLAAKVTRHMKDENEIIWIDRDPKRFRHVLNYLRSQTIWLDNVGELKAIQEEADFFNLNGLYQICQEKIEEVLSIDDENKRAVKRMEVLQAELKTLAENLESLKTNHRKEPISGVRRRRLDYGNYNEPVFRMDEDF